TTTQTDALGRVVKTTDNLRNGHPVDGQVRVVESRAYPVPGTVEITDAWGAVTVTKQDVFGREIETRAATGLTKITRYDDIAHTITTGLTPTGDLADADYTATQVMDVAGQITQTAGTRADALPVPTIASVFDGFGRETSTNDGAAAITTDLDVFGNPTTTTVTPQTTTGLPVVAKRRFDAFGASVEKTLIEGDQSRSGGSRTLDILGQTLSETDQNASTTTYEYTPDGKVAKATTGYGAVTVNTYHPVTRKLTETVTTSPIGDQVRTGFEYDPVTGDVLAVFDPADRAGTQVAYAYDPLHNITSITYPDGKQVTHTYDGNGRKASTTDIAGNTTSYVYDQAGLLTSAVQVDAGGTEIGRVGYTYDAYARVAELSRANGVTTRYAYTSRNEIATETTTGPGGTVQEARSYAYDDRGNLTHRTDTTTPADGSDPTVTTTAYEYDDQGRLTRSTLHQGDTIEGAVVSDTSYVVTVSGDISRETVTTTDPDTGVSQATVREFTYTPTGEIGSLRTTTPDGTVTTVAPTYDGAGNLTTAVDGTRYTYNAANQLVTEITPTGDTVRTGYWATGQRATLATTGLNDGSGEAEFYWDDTTLINDTHAQGDEPPGTASYLIGATRHTRTTTNPDTGPDTEYYTQDRHGNTTALTGSDGAPTTRYTYTDYGTPTTTGTGAIAAGDTTLEWVGNLSYQPFQYSGEQTAPNGAQYLRARTYDPGTMRFITKDTAQLHNTYNYAHLNPIMMTDPTGNTPDWESITNWVTGGMAIAFAAISIVSALYTGGASLGGLGIAGLIADAYTITTASLVLIDNITDIMSDDVALGLTLSETVLGIGAGAAAVGGAKAIKKLSVRVELDRVIGDTARIVKNDLKALGIDLRTKDLAKIIHDNGAEIAMLSVGKSADLEYSAEFHLDQANQVFTGLRWEPTLNGALGSPVTVKNSALASRLSNLHRLEGSILALGRDGTPMLQQVRKTIQPDLLTLKNAAGGNVYPDGKYVEKVAFQDAAGKLLYVDQNQFGRNYDGLKWEKYD
ncbi:RHS repeat-associated core domain-containing protein, partial [Microbacterium rhizomatis]